MNIYPIPQEIIGFIARPSFIAKLDLESGVLERMDSLQRTLGRIDAPFKFAHDRAACFAA
jgi:hypothetical protein